MQYEGPILRGQVQSDHVEEDEFEESRSDASIAIHTFLACSNHQ